MYPTHNFGLIIFACLFIKISYSQSIDSLKSISLESITVTAYKEKPLIETSLNIESLKLDSLRVYNNFNLSELISAIPGVHMLSTGPAISKPVIRGLYGNRVLILLSGLKFDNQQWQDEHGLGLSDMGLSKIELIKGPLSVLYGTEAIGGIVNLIEEEKPKVNTHEEDVSIKFNSNTLGGSFQAGYKVNNGNSWWRIRAGIENNADYSDGNNKRVLNSRFDAYNLKTSYGFQKKNWSSTTHFMSSFDRFGFIFSDINIKADSRWSRNLSDNPAHLVLLNILSSENKLQLQNNSQLHVNFGVQSNLRMEREGGGSISLNMHLLTFQYLLKWEKQISTNNKLILSHLGSLENNKNFGSRKIIPDANLQESNFSIHIETSIKHGLIIENGAGVGEKWIKTLLTSTVNTPDKEIHPFSKFSFYYNLFSGITYFPKPSFNIKLNISTGVRIANLAELSSNGLHEGVYTYEIGNPNMKNEQCFSGNLIFNLPGKNAELSVSPFYNFFYNYIYLAPTNEDWFGFPVYRYRQQNCTQYGTEISSSIKLITNLRFKLNYSAMISKTADGQFTPYTPAQKLSPSLNYSLKKSQLNNLQVFIDYDYFFAQNDVALGEISTPEYGLLNTGISASIVGLDKTYIFSLSMNNILNEAYFDHLSRYKYFGLLNMGRNLSLNFKIKFNGQINQK